MNIFGLNCIYDVDLFTLFSQLLFFLVFANLDPVITLLPQKLDAIEQIKTGMALCVTWMPSCGHSKIAAGYGDGVCLNDTLFLYNY